MSPSSWSVALAFTAIGLGIGTSARTHSEPSQDVENLRYHIRHAYLRSYTVWELVHVGSMYVRSGASLPDLEAEAWNRETGYHYAHYWYLKRAIQLMVDLRADLTKALAIVGADAAANSYSRWTVAEVKSLQQKCREARDKFALLESALDKRVGRGMDEKNRMMQTAKGGAGLCKDQLDEVMKTHLPDALRLAESLESRTR